MKFKRGIAAVALAGGLLVLATTAFADSIKQYVLTDAAYPVYVNGNAYESKELPLMNYEGYTYIPMRAVGDVLGAEVNWNDELKRAEITYGGEKPQQNEAFRKLKVEGSDGKYTVTGEARVFEAVMHYAVTDGLHVLKEDIFQLDEGAPEWSAFTLTIDIAKEKLPPAGDMLLVLYELSAKDGSRVNEVRVTLEHF